MKSITDIRRLIPSTLQIVEAFRLEQLKKIHQGRRLLWLPLLVSTISFLTYQAYPIPALLLWICCFTVFVLIYNLIIQRQAKIYQQQFKLITTTNFIKQLYPSTYYAPANYLPHHLFDSSKLFDSYTNYSGLDYMESKTVHELKFKFSKLEVFKENNNQPSNAVFQGLFIALKLPTTLPYPIKVLPSKIQHHIDSWDKIYETPLSTMLPNYKKIQLPACAPSRFTVYSDHKIDTHPILNEAFINAIFDLCYEWNSHLRISLIDRQLFIAVPIARNFFQTTIHQSAHDNPLLKDFCNILSECFSMIETIDHLFEANNTY